MKYPLWRLYYQTCYLNITQYLNFFSYLYFADQKVRTLHLNVKQVKRWEIITYKHGIYELLHESLTDKLRKLGNIRKVFKHHKMLA